MDDMRRIDVWIGRAVAAAGVVYVVLASVWPFAADAAGSPRVTVVSSIEIPARTGDLGLVRVVADVAARRERLARAVAVLPPWSIARDRAPDESTDDAPPPSTFAAVAVAAAIAISACALRDQRRAVAFDVR